MDNIINGNGRKALLLGATGLVGQCLLHRLLNSGTYSQVITVSRNSPEVEHPRLMAKLIDFRHLEKTLRLLTVDDIYCCFGTTIKKAGSKEAFRRVDLGYPLLAASVLAKCAEHFLVVSALGANVASPLFYNRIKGELEQAILALHYPFTTIARPSLLLGQRKESRGLESVGAHVSRALKPVFLGPLQNIVGVEATRVASALLWRGQTVVSGQRTKAVEILSSAMIQSAPSKTD